MNQAR